MLAEPVSRPWRRYLRLSVRGLIVLVLVIGAGLGWIVRSAHIQRDAVAAIEKAEGSVSNDWEWRDGSPIPGGKPWTPKWLTDLIGVDYFGHVTAVWFYGTPADTAMEQVGRLTRLQRLWLYDTSLSDAGLAHLKGLTNLTSLDVDQTQVTDAGLAHLKGLTNLKRLGLGGTQVTDAGLAHLKGLINLSVLDLDKTHVTNVGINDLKKALPSLTIHR